MCIIFLESHVGTMKPQLPPEIERIFPESVVKRIYSYVPHLPKKSPRLLPCTVSPSMERDLRLLQHKLLKGKSDMYLKELEDFVLDL